MAIVDKTGRRMLLLISWQDSYPLMVLPPSVHFRKQKSMPYTCCHLAFNVKNNLFISDVHDMDVNYGIQNLTYLKIYLKVNPVGCEQT